MNKDPKDKLMEELKKRKGVRSKLRFLKELVLLGERNVPENSVDKEKE
jgi:hypothetical protein